MIDIKFFMHVGLLATIMVGQTGLRIAGLKPFKEDGEDWSTRKFLIGTAEKIIVLFSIAVTYLGGSFFGADISIVTFGESEAVTVQAALDILILAVDALFAAKFINNVRVYFGLTEKVKEAKESIPEILKEDEPTLG